MRDQQPINVAVWNAPDDERASEIASAIVAGGLHVHELARAPAKPNLLLLLPGSGNDDLLGTCLALAEAYPNSPAVIFHTRESERCHPSIEHHVFELVPASVEAPKIVDHLRSVLSRWRRFEELKNSAASLAKLESTVELAYFDFRPETGTFRPSRQLRQWVGMESETQTMAPSPLLDRIHSDDRAVFAGTLFEAARSGTPFCVQIRMNDANGRIRNIRARGRAFEANDAGQSAMVFGVCEDITEHMQRLAEAETRSRVDELTGLGNRRYFDDCLASAMARAYRESENLALLYIDLDRFKLINDTLGHDAGDQLLRVIAARLSDAVRAEDVVCVEHLVSDGSTSEARVSRLGGDEFTVLLSGIHGPADAELVASRMLEAIGEPTQVAGQKLSPSASVGISVFPRDGATTDDLRKRADAALYAAKGAGGGYRFFQQSMEDGAMRRLALETDLRAALADETLELHYQPRIDYRDRRVVGAEALLRWTSPTLGRVSPDEVFQIATDAGLVSDLGRWALRRACQEAAYWASSQEEPCRLSINVCPAQFEQDDVFHAVVDALKFAGLPPELLDLEISETLLLQDRSETSQALEELRRMGVRIVLDDFGKGYSALAVLLSHPIDVLKLDRRLIETVGPDGDGSHLVAHVIRMAHDLNLEPVAEGVSHGDQADFLTEMGCHEMQGFFFSAAMPADVFREKLEIL